MIGVSRRLMLDEMDVRILAILQNDGRISKTALAERVHLSQSACLTRIQRLEKDKFILSYNATINFRAIAKLQMIFTEITLRNHRATEFSIFERYVQSIDDIVECHALGGGIDYILKIVCPDIEHYQGMIDNMLDAQLGVDRYFTYVVTKSVKSAAQPAVNSVVAHAKAAQG